jgi:hypothetical protein
VMSFYISTACLGRPLVITAMIRLHTDGKTESAIWLCVSYGTRYNQAIGAHNAITRSTACRR